MNRLRSLVAGGAFTAALTAVVYTAGAAAGLYPPAGPDPRRRWCGGGCPCRSPRPGAVRICSVPHRRFGRRRLCLCPRRPTSRRHRRVGGHRRRRGRCGGGDRPAIGTPGGQAHPGMAGGGGPDRASRRPRADRRRRGRARTRRSRLCAEGTCLARRHARHRLGSSTVASASRCSPWPFSP